MLSEVVMKRRRLLPIVGSICLMVVIAALPFLAACAAEAPTPSPTPTPTPTPTTPPAPAPAEEYPTRGIEIICGFGVGSGTDLLSRKVAEIASEYLGVPIHVTNAPGSSGMVGLGKVRSKPADGYTLGIITSSGLIGVTMGKYEEQLSNFTPVALMQLPAVWFFVRYDSPYKDFGELLEAAKTKEIKVIGSGATSGQALHIAYINWKMGTKLTFVPMSKQSERNAALLGGHAEAATDEIGDIYEELVATKTIRPLVVFYPERDPRLPDIPSSWEYDLPISLPTFRGYVVKKGTPESAVKKLEEALKYVNEHPAYKEWVKDMYLVPGGFKDSAEFAQFLDEKTAFLKDVLPKIGWMQ